MARVMVTSCNNGKVSGYYDKDNSKNPDGVISAKHHSKWNISHMPPTIV